MSLNNDASSGGIETVCFDVGVNMWIKDWWNRMMKKFKKEESIPETESVMELKPEEAPEPVPERKTSDETIIEMAQSASNDMSRAQEEANDPEGTAQEETVSEAGPVGPEETAEPEDTEEPYDMEEPDEPDPAEDVTWLGAEDDEKRDVDEEC